MKYINLGDGKIKISALGLGCMGMTMLTENRQMKNEMIKLIHSAFDMGTTFFDTAECYLGNKGKRRYCV